MIGIGMSAWFGPSPLLPLRELLVPKPRINFADIGHLDLDDHVGGRRLI